MNLSKDTIPGLGKALLWLLLYRIQTNSKYGSTFPELEKTARIRKVLGASIPNITVMMSKEFILWVIIANIIAWPAAYLAMNRWLENFAFRIHIHVWTFLFSAAMVVLFALVTVSYQTLRAAVTNPVDSLRYE